jgi:hypothetical protein
VTDAPNLYQKARTDVATTLGYDLDALSPEQSTRVDVATALRVLLDTQSGRLVRGESLDARELLMASEALSRLLPPLREPPSEPREDPRQVLWRIYSEMRERGEVPPEGGHQHRINGLEAEVAALKTQLAGAGLEPALPDMAMQKGNVREHGHLPIDPTEVVPPGEWRGERYARPGPDDPAPRSAAIIDAVPNPPAAAAPAKPPRPAWEDWLAAGGHGGPGYDRWSNRNGA